MFNNFFPCAGLDDIKCNQAIISDNTAKKGSLYVSAFFVVNFF